MSIVHCQGANALAVPRQHALRNRLQQHHPIVTDISAQFYYAVEAEQSLTAAEQTHLQTVLTEDGYGKPLALSSHYTFYVTPRLGTISPWCSKATDILHHCGFN